MRLFGPEVSPGITIAKWPFGPPLMGHSLPEGFPPNKAFIPDMEKLVL
jgi:hypothetical protein